MPGPILTSTPRISDLVKWEVNPNQSRKEVRLAFGATPSFPIKIGSILKIGAPVAGLNSVRSATIAANLTVAAGESLGFLLTEITQSDSVAAGGVNIKVAALNNDAIVSYNGLFYNDTALTKPTIDAAITAFSGSRITVERGV